MKGLEHELSLEHAPRFVAERARLQSRLEQERAQLHERERNSAAADGRFAELSARVERLTGELTSTQQDRLGAWPVVLLVSLGALAARTFAAPFRMGAVGALGAMLFGLLFGPRLFERATGTRTGPVSRPAFWTRLAAAVFGVFALLGGLLHVLVFWKALPPVFWLSAFTQGSALLSLLFAFRLGRDPNARETNTGITFVGLSLGVFGVVAGAWLAQLERLPGAVPVLLISAFAPLVPATALFAMSMKPRVERAWPTFASLACAALSCALGTLVLHDGVPTPEPERFAQGWAALQLAVLGGALAHKRLVGVAANVLAGALAVLWLVSRWTA